MVQGYYTLDEASRVLGMAPDKLSLMAQRREIRAFADRGTWRFRTQDVEEMARRLGRGSSPDLQLGDVEAPPSGPGSGMAPKSGTKLKDPGVFDFNIPTGESGETPGVAAEGPSSGRSKPLSGKSGPGSGIIRKPGSDSDVHLVRDIEGSDEFKLPEDSDVNIGDLPSTSSPSSAKKKSGPKTPGSAPGSKKKKTMTPPGARVDSGVRLVPMEDEETISLSQPPLSPADSDVRLELAGGAPSKEGPNPPTEEIDLDAELLKAEEASRVRKSSAKEKPKTKIKLPDSAHTEAYEVPAKPKPKSKLKPTEKPLSSDSSFEISADDLEVAKDRPATKPDSSDFDLDVGAAKPDSSDFDLNVAAEDEEVSLGELTPSGDMTGTSGASGINLHSPADSGINLKQGTPPSDDSVEFELSLDEEGGTPAPTKAPSKKGLKPKPKDKPLESDSEFELTLDDSGGLAPLEEESASGAVGVDKDIFETDFEMPALDDESVSEAVALDDSDTDLESSDFDLALGEEDSGSQVVAIEGEEEADEAAATVARPGRGAKVAEGAEEEIEDLISEEGGEVEEEEELVGAGTAAAAPANWGILPAIVMLPCVLIMLVLGMMAFELLHGMWGYKQTYKPTGAVIESISQLFGEELPKDK